jgi:alanine racemase
LPSPTTLPPTYALIDLSALEHNLAQVRHCLSPGCDILAVVKADAYGHGAVSVSQVLISRGITRFGVATLAEGILLRQAGIAHQILVMGAVLPDQFPEVIAHGLTPVMYDLDTADHLARLLRDRRERYRVHIKVDTGMGRLGLAPEQVLAVLRSAHFKGLLQAEGLMTHLADADNEDATYTKGQIGHLESLTDQLDAAGLSVPIIHAANTAAILAHPMAHLTLVRPGLMLYGYHTVLRPDPALDLRPVLTFGTTVAQVRTLQPGQSVSYGRTHTAVRPSRVAVLPIGYADGYNRALSNRGAVLIRGRRARIVGRVCMDMTMVDVTDIPGVQPGEPVMVIGQQGEERITAVDLAVWLNTIPYEVLCAIGQRVPRLYSYGSPRAQ